MNIRKKLYTEKTLHIKPIHPIPLPLPAIRDFFTDSQNWDKFHIRPQIDEERKQPLPYRVYSTCLLTTLYSTFLVAYQSKIWQSIICSSLFLWLAFKVFFFLFKIVRLSEVNLKNLSKDPGTLTTRETTFL